MCVCECALATIRNFCLDTRTSRLLQILYNITIQNAIAISRNVAAAAVATTTTSSKILKDTNELNNGTLTTTRREKGEKKKKKKKRRRKSKKKKKKHIRDKAVYSIFHKPTFVWQLQYVRFVGYFY